MIIAKPWIRGRSVVRVAPMSATQDIGGGAGPYSNAFNSSALGLPDVGIAVVGVIGGYGSTNNRVLSGINLNGTSANVITSATHTGSRSTVSIVGWGTHQVSTLSGTVTWTAAYSGGNMDVVICYFYRVEGALSGVATGSLFPSSDNNHGGGGNPGTTMPVGTITRTVNGALIAAWVNASGTTAGVSSLTSGGGMTEDFDNTSVGSSQLGISTWSLGKSGQATLASDATLSPVANFSGAADNRGAVAVVIR